MSNDIMMSYNKLKENCELEVEGYIKNGGMDSNIYHEVIANNVGRVTDSVLLLSELLESDIWLIHKTLNVDCSTPKEALVSVLIDELKQDIAEEYNLKY